MQRPIIILWLLLFVLSAQAQEKFQKKSSKANSEQVLLAKAQKLSATQPTEAIQLIETLLAQTNKRKNKPIEAEAYFLLGSIFEDIEQPELALQRYQQALKILEPTNQAEQLARTHAAIAKIESFLNNGSKTLEHFQMCLNLTRQEEMKTQCLEGLADLAILQQDFDKGKRLNDSLRGFGQFKADSLFTAKVFARDAEVFANKNQIPQAQESFLNSIQNLPVNQANYSEYKAIDRAKIALKQNNKDVNQQFTFNLNIVKDSIGNLLPSEVIVTDQLELAESFYQKGDKKEATKLIESSKTLFGENVSPKLQAKVYKKSSEWNYSEGAYEQALKDYQNYTLQNDLVLQIKEKELDQNVAILKGQKKIDLQEKDVAIQEREAALLKNQLFTQQVIIGLLSLLLLAALVSFYFIMKNVRARRKANQLLLLKSLRTQMNPHFIFNALNSVNNFISKNDERAANKFLSKFSRLMRMVLDYSQRDFISLEEELQLIELYLQLEHSRFRDKFEYAFEKNADLPPELKVPPMLVQPFIENAIWHGLRYKKELGQLLVRVESQATGISILIQDDGIGRAKSQALKTSNQKKYQSTGLQNVGKRVALVNQIYQSNYKIKVEDAQPENEDPGTLVRINIPF